MTISINRIVCFTGAALLAASLSTPVSAADPMLSTGGYAREMQTMGMMKMLDANGDHMVSESEFMDFYAATFDALDTNKDGVLDAKEWVGTKGEGSVTVGTGGYNRQLRKMKMMGMMDKDGDHKVTKEEFIGFHEAIFKAMDTKGDGMLTSATWIKKLGGN